MQIFIALFQRHFSMRQADFYWTIEAVGPTVLVEYNTWPRYYDSGDSQSGPEQPAAIGIVTLTVDTERDQLKPWRATCSHPGGDLIVVHEETLEKSLEELKAAVAKR